VLKELLPRGMMVAPANDARDSLADEHIRARHSLLQVKGPDGSETLTPAPAPRFMGRAVPSVMYTPLLGEDNARLPVSPDKPQ